MPPTFTIRRLERYSGEYLLNIDFSVQRTCRVRIEIVDHGGTTIRLVMDELQHRGKHGILVKLDEQQMSRINGNPCYCLMTTQTPHGQIIIKNQKLL